MEYKIKNNCLVIELPARIDSANASAIDEELFNIINNNDAKNVELDGNHLEYISSAGLRIILKVKKAKNSLIITNVNNDVYDIFDMTGFSEMIEIHKRMKELSIENAKKIGEGAKGIVYRYSDELIVKVYKNDDSLELIKREHELSRKAFVLGLPTAISYSTVIVDGKYASVFELLDSKSVSNEIGEDVSTLEDYAARVAELLKQIHSTPIKAGELRDIKEDFLKRREAIRGYLEEDENQKLDKFFDGIIYQATLIHGDFHTNNIMIQNGELILIDMDTLASGNPLFEMANIYCAYVAFGCIDKEYVEKFMGFSYDNCLKFYDLFIHHYYQDEYNEEIEESIKLLSYIRYFRHLLHRSDNSQVSIDNMNKVLAIVKDLISKL